MAIDISTRVGEQVNKAKPTKPNQTKAVVETENNPTNTSTFRGMRKRESMRARARTRKDRTSPAQNLDRTVQVPGAKEQKRKKEGASWGRSSRTPK